MQGIGRESRAGQTSTLFSGDLSSPGREELAGRPWDPSVPETQEDSGIKPLI